MKISIQVSLILLLLLTTAFQLPKSVIKKVDKEIKNTFQIEVFAKTVVSIDATLAKSISTQINTQNLYKLQADNQFIGYVYIAKAPSKTDEFDYMILFNTDLEIIKTKVLVYREDYGNEIGSKRWLKQFIGKTAADTFSYGDDIDAISGATISANSMTKAIQNTLRGIAVLKENKAI